MTPDASPISEDEFAALVRENQALVLNVAYGFFGNYHDAEDAAQETFVKAYRNYASFKKNAKVSTWLYRITINECITIMRKRKRREKLRDDYTANYRAETLADHDEEMKRFAIREALAATPEQYRVVITLKDIEGRSIDEIAEILAISPGTVASRLFRGRKHIKDRLVRNKEFSYDAET